jgi:hypothetical protein
MTTIARPPTATRATGDPTRNHVRAAGIFYLITFAASLPAFFLIGSAVNPDLTVAAGHATPLYWAGLLDFVNALAAVGTAVALFPVLRRHNESLALGFVTSRLLEAAIIAGADSAAMTPVSQALVAVRDWTFLFGPGLMASLNAVLLGTVLYRSRLVPRIIPAVGLIGAPLLMLANLATLFGHNEQASGITMLATLPIAFWELSVGTWMTVKGFRPTESAGNRS